MSNNKSQKANHVSAYVKGHGPESMSAHHRAHHGRNICKDVENIPVIFPPVGSPYADEHVSEDDMGKNDPNTITYINVLANTIPPGHEAHIKKLEDMMDLTHKWLDTHTGLQTRAQLNAGTLPSDMSKPSQLKRSNYRIKVLDVILGEGRCPWINLSYESIITRSINIRKVEFHTKLIAEMLVGITSVTAISRSIEAALTAISNIIIQSKDDIQESSVWSFFNVFTWDHVTQSVKASLRIIHYNVSGEMITVNVYKASYEQIHLGFNFRQTECTFIDSLWAYYEPSIKAFLLETGNNSIRDPIGGEITP